MSQRCQPRRRTRWYRDDWGSRWSGLEVLVEVDLDDPDDLERTVMATGTPLVVRRFRTRSRAR